MEHFSTARQGFLGGWRSGRCALGPELIILPARKERLRVCKRSEHDAGRRHSPASKVAVVWNEHTYHKSVSYSSAFRARKNVSYDRSSRRHNFGFAGRLAHADSETHPRPWEDARLHGVGVYRLMGWRSATCREAGLLMMTDTVFGVGPGAGPDLGCVQLERGNRIVGRRRPCLHRCEPHRQLAVSTACQQQRQGTGRAGHFLSAAAAKARATRGGGSGPPTSLVLLRHRR